MNTESVNKNTKSILETLKVGADCLIRKDNILDGMFFLENGLPLPKNTLVVKRISKKEYRIAEHGGDWLNTGDIDYITNKIIKIQYAK